MSTVNKIASFAVLDLETTNLPDYNFNKAKITEVSVHGFSVEAFRNANPTSCPRVNHTLTLLFNPLMQIHPDSEKITGLDNYMLEKESSFDTNAANTIVSFLKHLQQPVCLVAHNGYNFDFRIFKQAFDKLGVKLPNNITCIDTLVAIKELDRLAKEQEYVEHDSQGSRAEIPLPDVDEIIVLTGSQSDEEENEKITNSQKLNETTPKRPPKSLTPGKRRRKTLENDKETPQYKKQLKPRSLFDTPCQPICTGNQYGQYKLGNIYRRLFAEEPEVTHHAEADVVILKKIMLHYGESFVEYVESNATPFADVKDVGAR